MKTTLLVICMALGYLKVNAQAGIEAQFGGSNFLGASINTKYSFQLGDSSNHAITPSLGIGFLLPSWDAPTSIIHSGINYSFRNFGIGVEASGFTPNPFIYTEKTRSFVDLILYPNLNYTFQFKSPFYLSVTAGLYFAYSNGTDFYSTKTRWIYEGDPIPGAGLTVGYRL